MDDDEIIDDAEDQYDTSQDLGDSQLEQYESSVLPSAREKSDLYNWFWRIVQLGSPEFRNEESLGEESLKLSKVGNLSKTEIGDHKVPIRDALNLANLGQIFHHTKFGDYWRSTAMITSASSMSKNGWLIEQSISQKRVRQREKKTSAPGSEKWRIFGKKKGGDQVGQGQSA